MELFSDMSEKHFYYEIKELMTEWLKFWIKINSKVSHWFFSRYFINKEIKGKNVFVVFYLKIKIKS